MKGWEEFCGGKRACAAPAALLLALEASKRCWSSRCSSSPLEICASRFVCVPWLTTYVDESPCVCVDAAVAIARPDVAEIANF